ncbi:GNAT family N-acetyltransferase [Egicoccus sp. AB-alg2]|uniref:GNAT family N-acetyltransferase n=1 Tax=Egicoccus sp. AB-alg2 TaxID=3242693 RepID=UPI00359E07DB
MSEDLPALTLPTPPDAFTLRRATWNDLFAVAGLYAACSTARVGAVTTRPGDLRVRWLELGGPDDVLLVERPGASPSLVATLEFQVDVDPWTDELDLHVEGRVHPDWEGHGLATYLLDHAEARARNEAWRAGRATAVLRTTVVDGDARARSFFAHRGFVPVRYLLELRLDLHAAPPHPVWPPGVTCRSFVPGQDEPAVWAAHLDAFADNPEFLPLELDDWVESHVRRDPAFDPSLVLVAQAAPGVGVAADGQPLEAPTVIGFAWCRAGAEGAAEEGWIRDLAVVPAWRGRGVGMALLRAAFAAFRARGLTGVRLEVDDVTLDGAVALYRRAGMRIARRTEVLEQLLVAAPGPGDVPLPPDLPPAA